MLRNRISRHIHAFFSAKSHPANLAIFRIVLFGTILGLTNTDGIVAMTDLPPATRVPVPGYENFMQYIPFDHTFASVAALIFFISCIFSLTGFCTPVALPIAFFSGIYVLGIPQFFGKINHNHHFVWFMGVLMFSRCADALSVDALLRKWKNPDAEPLSASKEYALPLRYVWLLIGIIYFFPGYWKLHSAGMDWIFGDNVRNIMHWKWFELGDFLPFFRIDRYPLLYKAAGALVIFFELGFIVAITFRRLAPFVWIGGLLFHAAMSVFMNIGFLPLVLCYVAFVDWFGLYQRLRKKPVETTENEVSPTRIKAIHGMGGMFLVVNTVLGFALFDTWPFGVYPTFSAIFPNDTWYLRIVPDNDIAPPTEQEAWDVFGGSPRWTAKQHQLIATNNPALCRGIWLAFVNNYPRFAEANSVDIERIRRYSDPDRSDEPPLHQSVLCSMQKTGESWPKQ